MTEPIAHGVATREWAAFGGNLDSVETKAELLRLWDQATERLNAIWPTIPEHRFAEVDKAFGQWENSGINTILTSPKNSRPLKHFANTAGLKALESLEVFEN